MAMSGSATFAGRAEALAAQQAAQGLAAEREAFLLDQFFAQVMIVETGIGSAGQMHNPVPHALGQATMAGPSAAGVCQSPLHARRNHRHSLQFFLAQRVCLHRGDIFT